MGVKENTHLAVTTATILGSDEFRELFNQGRPHAKAVAHDMPYAQTILIAAAYAAHTLIEAPVVEVVPNDRHGLRVRVTVSGETGHCNANRQSPHGGR